MRITNATKNTVLSRDAGLAKSFLARMKGLLGGKELKEGQALILKPCNSVHTLFMRFPIEAVFVDKDNKIIAARQNLRPWRITPVYFAAALAIEFPAGVIKLTQTAAGDIIAITP